MKKIITLGVALFITMISQALTVESTAGNLSDSIISAGGNFNTVTDLTITGTIDARDFKLMRDSMDALAVLDLSGSTIVSYTGTEGTVDWSYTFADNEIPNSAFYTIQYPQHGKPGLTTFIFPDTVTSIGASAFMGCTGIESITIPSMVTYLGNKAFKTCKSFTNITIPPALTYIGEEVFMECDSLRSITIPSSVTDIGRAAFVECGEVHVNPDNPNYSSLDGVLFNKNKTTILHCDAEKVGEYVIPSSVTSIGASAFQSCHNLTKVVIPFLVTSIDRAAFRNCINLTSITLPPLLTSIEDLAFYYCINLKSIYVTYYGFISLSSKYFVFQNVHNACILYVSMGQESYYSNAADYWKDFSVIVGVNPLKSINVSAGNLSTTLTSEEKQMINHLLLTGSIDARDIYFMRDSLPSLRILDLKGVSIDGYTGLIDTTLFRSAVVEKTFPPNTLPISSFNDKLSLEKIVLPSSLIDIQDKAFYNCFNLDSITLYNPLPVDLSATVNVFNNVNKSTCVLSVPAGSESSYRSANIWQDFLNIEIPNEVGESQVKEYINVFVQNGQLKISDLPLGKIVAIYNTQGVPIYNQLSTSDTLVVKLPVHGIYIVKIGEQSTKVIY